MKLKNFVSCFISASLIVTPICANVYASNNINSVFSNYSGSVEACCEIDFDKDGQYEVIVRNSNNMCDVYKIVNGSYQKIGNYYEQYGSYKYNNGIVVSSGGSGMAYYTNYYISNNKLVEGNVVASYEGDGYNYNFYTVNGKNVSKSEYNKKESEILSNPINYKSYKASNIKVILNGKTLSFDQSPYIDNGTTKVPMRKIFESLGASVSYNASNKTITAVKGSTTILLTTGSSIAKINGKQVSLATPIENKNGTTMVPLRFVSESLGASVKWDSVNKVVTINS